MLSARLGALIAYLTTSAVHSLALRWEHADASVDDRYGETESLVIAVLALVAAVTIPLKPTCGAVLALLALLATVTLHLYFWTEFPILIQNPTSIASMVLHVVFIGIALSTLIVKKNQK